MFGARFDPTALEEPTVVSVTQRRNLVRKRRLSQTSLSSDEHDLQLLKNEIVEDSDSLSDDLSDDLSSDESEEESEEEENENENVVNNDVAKDIDSVESEESEDSDHSNDPNDAMDVDSEVNTEVDVDYVSKYKSVFDKFKKSVPETKKIDSESSSEEEDDVEMQDLMPLPQPALPRDKRLISSNSHLKNLDWLATPIYASPEDSKPFSEFEISPFLLKNLERDNFTTAFSVQIAIMDILLHDIKRNRLEPDVKGDILVNAATGSGKTLAYLIPIIEALHNRVVPRVRAIVLVPTKPLINQVKATFVQLSRGTNLSVVSLRNDVSIKEEGIKIVNSPPDIIVSTPGRLVEHISNKSINLNSLQFLVIDEADRLLNQSFQNWCQVLISSLEGDVNIAEEWKITPQKLIFSATLTTDSGKLSALKFQKPRLVIVNDRKQLVNEIFNVPSSLSEYTIQFGTAKASIKPLILAKYLLENNKLSNVLIFTKSNEASIRLCKLLELMFGKLHPSMNIAYINSTNNKSAIRTKILKDFSTQKINILVATDLIARGIDILSITDVINYDLPNSSREYVHRVGRTARANQTGHAYTLCFGKGEAKWFKKIILDVGRGDKTIEKVEIELKELIVAEDENVYNECLESLLKQVFH